MEDLGSVCPFVQSSIFLAADGGPVCGAPEPRGRRVGRWSTCGSLFPGSRAGYRSAQVHHRRRPTRTLVPEPQLAEQVGSADGSFLFLDSAVCGAARRHSSSWGWRTKFWSSRFFLGQRSTASPSKKRISVRIVEQIVDPVSRGGLHGTSSSHSPAGDEERAGEPGKGFFALFPKIKKCEGHFAPGVGTAPRVEPIHAGCSAGGLRRVGAAQG